MTQVIDWLQNYYHEYGRAIRVRYYVPRVIQCVFRINLRHHQRHVCIHSECAAVVYHYRAEFSYGVGIFNGSACACGSKSDVDSFEVVVVLQLLDDDVLAFK